MNIRFSNVAQPSSRRAKGEGSQYYDWRVFVDESPDVLKTIDRVTYFLHPTFPNPVRTVDDRSTGFALSSSGWGEFEIRAQLHFKDGTTRTTSFMLDLSKER